MRKKIIITGLIVFIVVIAVAAPAVARPHVGIRGGIWIGPGPGWGPWWWGPPFPLYPYPYYAEPPVVIQQQPPVIYEEPQPSVQQQYYWYYCPDQKGYYPYIKKCPGGWMKVVPSAPPTQ